ncbi:MAG: electron transfer flavoprotein subunit alpha/FixB family protein [Anaerolineales bacterium]|jgi:electron transfer flavoprotein alpha subunit|nr:electron transfer flavoprotein subunit alpha/FixB family protein [Anaerolineales bacterium]HJO32705.1 electron transfer flavoprotein subunit alpha/FixB family protein [Anaerolineales bacterium]
MVLAFLELQQGEISDLSLQMLNLAGDIAAQMNTEVQAALVGEDGRTATGDVAAYGISELHVVEHEELADYAPDAWAQGLLQLMAALQPKALIAAGSDRGNELLARVSVRGELSLASNCITASAGERLRVTRVRWGGSLVEEAVLHSSPALLSVMPHMLAPIEAVPAESEPNISSFQATLNADDLRVRVTAHEPAGGGVSLNNAPVVVSGGRGVGSAEGFDILETLAGQLGAVVGCSRAVTNNGWRPHSDQVGQTGAQISPELYIACGISGAIQHMSGCRGAKRILAINTDPEAPILQRADYAVIGDLHEVLPALSAEVDRITR